MSQPPPPGNGAGDISSELESFRQQWRAEVRAKAGAAPSGSAGSASNAAVRAAGSTTAATASLSAATATAVGSIVPQRPAGLRRNSSAAGGGGGGGDPQTGRHLLSSGKTPLAEDNDDDYVQPRAFDDDIRTAAPPVNAAVATSEPLVAVDKASSEGGRQEPRSALEHYERAVEKEALGSLGDSLKHYRTAFRMDSTVDKTYKNKHFPAAPPRGSAPETENPPSEAAAAPAKPVRQGPPPTLKELIASFAGLGIERAPPPIEGMTPPPCPLAELPDELLVHVLEDVALDDVGDFVRLAQVCRKLAFLVATEDRIWRRVCVGPEFGFAHMHRAWERTIAWGPLEDADGACHRQRQRQAASSLATTTKLRQTAVYPSWQRMFRLRPRIRFNGCYISTVNYIRPGQPSASLVTWNNPVHIVTYFRYLRFFRDGTVISLLTTSEPPDVVHHLTKDLVALHQGGAMAHLPSIVMQNALRGRWCMSGIQDKDAASDDGDGGVDLRSRAEPASLAPAPASPYSSMAAAADAESDVVVETEGVGKYYYRMELAFRSVGKGTRNNKLNWRGFYSYDRQTDDWGEFGLKNDRPFFFSRVRSYGAGE